jgi:DNA repair exonuclease SbcCD ATPase subunit
LIFEELKGENKELIDKVSDLELNEKKLYAQIQSLEDQFKGTNEQLEQVRKELNAKNKTLELLVEQNIIKEQDLEMISANIGEIIAYNEEQQKLKIEEVRERTRNELTFEYELTINDLENRLQKEKQLVSEAEKRAKDNEQKSRTIEEELAKLNKDYQELKNTIDISSKTLNFIQSMLSTHPLYSSIMILANLGGTLPLDTLAKSVGAAPLRLRHLMEELVERELITIGEGDNPTVKIVRDY